MTCKGFGLHNPGDLFQTFVMGGVSLTLSLTESVVCSDLLSDHTVVSAIEEKSTVACR